MSYTQIILFGILFLSVFSILFGVSIYKTICMPDNDIDTIVINKKKVIFTYLFLIFIYCLSYIKPTLVDKKIEHFLDGYLPIFRFEVFIVFLFYTLFIMAFSYGKWAVKFIEKATNKLRK